MNLKLNNIDEIQQITAKLYSRLFGRHHTKNEINFIVDQLETRYADNELYRINEICTMLDKMVEYKVDTVNDVIQNNFSVIIDSVNRSTKNLQGILDAAGQENEITISNRLEREKFMTELNADRDRKKKEIDDNFLVTIKELEQKYHELDNK